MVGSRVTGTPLEYILGWAEFCGLRIAVDAGVFVPRRRTEFLARQAIALAEPGATVVELCCGSGAVARAIIAAHPRLDLSAADIDPAAVRCARRNLAGTGAAVFEGDLYDPLPARLRGRVDLLLANAPYVPTAAIGMMPQEARTHEPALALDGGVDGLEVQRRIAADAASWLSPGGHLLAGDQSRPGGARRADAPGPRAARPHAAFDEARRDRRGGNPTDQRPTDQADRSDDADEVGIPEVRVREVRTRVERVGHEQIRCARCRPAWHPHRSAALLMLGGRRWGLARGPRPGRARWMIPVVRAARGRIAENPVRGQHRPQFRVGPPFRDRCLRRNLGCPDGSGAPASGTRR